MFVSFLWVGSLPKSSFGLSLALCFMEKRGVFKTLLLFLAFRSSLFRFLLYTSATICSSLFLLLVLSPFDPALCSPPFVPLQRLPRLGLLMCTFLLCFGSSALSSFWQTLFFLFHNFFIFVIDFIWENSFVHTFFLCDFSFILWKCFVFHA